MFVRPITPYNLEIVLSPYSLVLLAMGYVMSLHS